MKSTILIADDDILTQKTLKHALQGQYNLIFASNGKAALEMAREATPDVILLDGLMPELNGFEVCEHLRLDPNPMVANTPIIMVTGMEKKQETWAQGMSVGVDTIVTKPWDLLDLQVTLRAAARHAHDHKRLLWVLEQAHTGHILTHQGDVIYVNPKARHYLDMPQNGGLVHTPFLALVSKHYGLYPQEAWENWPKQLNTVPLHLVRPETKYSEALWLQVTTKPINATKLHIQLDDVTRSRENQRIVWSVHKLLAHKINTSLSTAFYSLEVLVREKGETVDELVADAYDSLRTLNSYVTEMFQYINIPDRLKKDETGCNPLRDITTILESIKFQHTDEGWPTINLKKNNQLYSLKKRLPISAKTFRLILEELLSNAKKFHPQKEPIIDITLEATADGVQLQVQDNGVNLSPLHISHIWTSYYQAENGFTGQVPGLGLGLAEIAGFLARIGGTYGAHNRLDGPGLVVNLFFPWAVQENGHKKGALNGA